MRDSELSNVCRRLEVVVPVKADDILCKCPVQTIIGTNGCRQEYIRNLLGVFRSEAVRVEHFEP